MSQHKHLYNTARWKQRRAAQLTAEPLCRMHRALGLRVLATVADHVVAHRGDADLFFEGQLQSLCKACHDGHKQAQEHSRDGLLRGAGHDGKPLDLAHPWHGAPGGPSQGGVQMSRADSQKTGLAPPFAEPRNGQGGSIHA